MAEVIVVGAGPAGMMLAAELVLGGVEVCVLERRAGDEQLATRAGGFHSRTIEILDQRGIADRFLDAGQTAQTARFGNSTLDISDFPTRHPYGLALWQNRIEPILAEWIDELGVRVERGREVAGFTQDAGGVEVVLSDGERVQATYVVGADGGRSTIRTAAGIEFAGWDATRSNLIAEVEVTQQPPRGVRMDERGAHGLQPLDDGRTYRVVTAESQLTRSAHPTLTDLSAALKRVFGTDFGVHSPRSISRFTDATRQATAYRNGRALLVGDAAHIHYPAGGQGIGLGIQDAVNLGWKLAQVVAGISAPSLLDSYHDERHPADARALSLSMAQTVLQGTDARTAALTEIVGELTATPSGRAGLAARIHGLDTAYEPAGAHPLIGRRMPDLDLETAAGPTRVYALLHDARPLLLNLGEPRRFDHLARASRVRVQDARASAAWILPVLGEVEPATVVLVRPDGHVAWAGHGDEAAITSALQRWFGATDGAPPSR